LSRVACCSPFFPIVGSSVTAPMIHRNINWYRSATSSSFRGGMGNFHKISFDNVIVLIQSWYNIFANGHSQSSLRSQKIRAFQFYQNADRTIRTYV